MQCLRVNSTTNWLATALRSSCFDETFVLLIAIRNVLIQCDITLKATNDVLVY
jgi:hypothetical protein